MCELCAGRTFGLSELGVSTETNEQPGKPVSSSTLYISFSSSKRNVSNFSWGIGARLGKVDPFAHAQQLTVEFASPVKTYA